MGFESDAFNSGRCFCTNPAQTLAIKRSLLIIHYQVKRAEFNI
jgi:hypothetical protein